MPQYGDFKQRYSGGRLQKEVTTGCGATCSAGRICSCEGVGAGGTGNGLISTGSIAIVTGNKTYQHPMAATQAIHNRVRNIRVILGGRIGGQAIRIKATLFTSPVPALVTSPVPALAAGSAALPDPSAARPG